MSQALNTLLEHARRQRDEALSALLQCEESVRRLREQGRQLQTYLQEYEARDPARSGQVAQMDSLLWHRAFMQRLLHAVQQQQAQLDATEQRLTELRNALLAHEIRVASVDKLLQRRDQLHQRRSVRAEQRLSDEAAARQRWRSPFEVEPDPAITQP